MRRLISFILPIALFGCITEHAENNKEVNNSINEVNSSTLDYTNENILWDKVFRKYLEDSLWDERDIYDAGHNIMIPIHAAFYKKNEDWINDIDKHFFEFSKNYKWNNEIGLLSSLHYYYALSRYLALRVEYGHPIEQYHLDLSEQLIETLGYHWKDNIAWHWSHEGFKGIKERLEYKINLTTPRFSYDRAIIDEELFLVAIASDLKYFKNKFNEESNDILNEMNEFGQAIFLNEGEFTQEGGWLFQGNVWQEHPDFSYSGYETLEEVKIDIRRPANKIFTDSSHGTRFPLQIYSVMKATDNLENQRALSNVRRALEIQFYEKILHKRNGFYILTNFMDGSNGVYRYDYQTNKGTGYGPFSLSGILMIGWYNFLNTDRISQVYKEMSEQFPIDIEAYRELYLDKTTRERNPLATEPNAYYSGLYQLNLLLSREPLLNELEEY